MPAPAASAIVPHAEAMPAAAAVQRLSSADLQDERGLVRITAGQLVVIEVLPLIIADICLRLPPH
jgi:hypothetical protein